MIDEDKSGSLSAAELQTKLGDQINEAYYSKLIAFFDDDKDGEISLKEFKKMMRNILQKWLHLLYFLCAYLLINYIIFVIAKTMETFPVPRCSVHPDVVS